MSITNNTVGMPQHKERALLAALARRYYFDGISQVALAKEFSISRFKVARMLQSARRGGIVTITIPDDHLQAPELSAQLARHLNIASAQVVFAWGNSSALRRQVGAAAAQLLAASLKPGEIVGIGWGRTLFEMTEALSSLPQVAVVQLTGAVRGELEHSPVELLRKVACRSGGSATPIFAPMVIDDVSAAGYIRRQSDVEAAMHRFDELTTAVVSIGSWRPPQSQLAASLPQTQRTKLLAAGVRAEVTATLLAGDGSIVGDELTQRCISISAAQLRKCPQVIGVASGSEKAAAVIAACRARLITTIVADHMLAETILASNAQ